MVLIPKLLEAMNVDVNSLKADLKSDLEKLPKVSGGSTQLYEVLSLIITY